MPPTPSYFGLTPEYMSLADKVRYILFWIFFALVFSVGWVILSDPCAMIGSCTTPPGISNYNVTTKLPDQGTDGTTSYAVTESTLTFDLLVPARINTTGACYVISFTIGGEVTVVYALLTSLVVTRWVPTWVANSLTNQDATLAAYTSSGILCIWTYTGASGTWQERCGVAILGTAGIAYTGSAYYAILATDNSTRIMCEPLLFSDAQAPVSLTTNSTPIISLNYVTLRMYGESKLVVSLLQRGHEFYQQSILNNSITNVLSIPNCASAVDPCSTPHSACCIINIATSRDQYIALLVANGLIYVYNNLNYYLVAPPFPEFPTPTLQFALTNKPGYTVWITTETTGWRYDLIWQTWTKSWDTPAIPRQSLAVLQRAIIVFGRSGQLLASTLQNNYYFYKSLVFPFDGN